jgi:hypothetical protein
MQPIMQTQHSFLSSQSKASDKNSGIATDSNSEGTMFESQPRDQFSFLRLPCHTKKFCDGILRQVTRAI